MMLKRNWNVFRSELSLTSSYCCDIIRMLKTSERVPFTVTTIQEAEVGTEIEKMLTLVEQSIAKAKAIFESKTEVATDEQR